MDPAALDAVTQLGAIGLLLYLTPLLRKIERHLSRLAGAGGELAQAARDLGVELPANASLREAVVATARRFGAALALVVALTVTGCCNAAVAESAAALEADLEVFAGASQPAPDVERAPWDRAREALLDHARELNRRAHQ